MLCFNLAALRRLTDSLLPYLPRAMSQQKQKEWLEQWQRFEDKERWLFEEWIHPVTLEEFRDKRVLDAGCGSGQHVSFVAPYAREVVGLDLNAVSVAADRCRGYANASFVEGDLAQIAFEQPFDIVYCVGVIHHTDDPERSFANLARLTKSGGKTLVWAYSDTGNFLNRTLVEGMKEAFVHRLSTRAKQWLSKIMTALLYIPVYTLYFLPLPWLPYYEYFQNFRKLSFARNDLNVFDKLNAPQTHFISRERIEGWFRDHGYKDIVVTPYKGVSWRGVGTRA